MQTKEWLSLKDAAELLGVHPCTVRNWSNDGKLPVYRTNGGHRRYRAQEIELWQQSHDNSEKADFDGMIQRAIQVVHLKVSSGQLEKQAWYLKLAPDARDQPSYRRLSGAMSRRRGRRRSIALRRPLSAAVRLARARE